MGNVTRRRAGAREEAVAKRGGDELMTARENLEILRGVTW
jgi:hypothetical protein